MDDTIFSSSDSSEQIPEKISNFDVSQAASSQPYQLTVKRCFLALFIMYASQTLVGLVFSYGLRFIQGAGDGLGTIDIQMIGMVSVLLGGAITLLWVWTDISQFGPSFLPQIGLQQSVIKTNQSVMLVFLLFSATHFLAWTYRSVILPLVGQDGIIGGAVCPHSRNWFCVRDGRLLSFGTHCRASDGRSYIQRISAICIRATVARIGGDFDNFIIIYGWP